MASIKINTNIGEISAKLKKKLEKLGDKEYILRPICFDIIDLMTKRIHEEGIASDGGQIGTYGSGYLKYRQREHKRTSDTKVIVSLTRQLENDWSVIATEKGYGVGFQNSFNLQKARWVEEIKDKIIFNLSSSEKAYVTKRIQELTDKALQDDI